MEVCAFYGYMLISASTCIPVLVMVLVEIIIIKKKIQAFHSFFFSLESFDLKDHKLSLLPLRLCLIELELLLALHDC